MSYQGLLSRYPHEEAFRLQTQPDGSGGQVVMLPVHQRELEFICLSGTADEAALNEALASQDLVSARPVEGSQPPPPPAGRGSIGIYFSRFYQGDVGPYEEMMVCIHAQQSDPFLIPKLGWYMWDVKVTSDLPLRVGREYWGYDKHFGEIDYHLDGNGTYSFQVSVSDGSGGSEPEIQGRVSPDGLQALPTHRFEYVAITPYVLRRSWARSIVEGNAHFKAFDEDQDYLAIFPNSELGQKLTSVDFKPESWTIVSGASAVAFKGDELPVRQRSRGAILDSDGTASVSATRPVASQNP